MLANVPRPVVPSSPSLPTREPSGLDAAVFAAITADSPQALTAALAAGGGVATEWIQHVVSDNDSWDEPTTPLMEAIKRPSAVSLVTVLLDAGANPQHQPGDRVPLRLAAVMQRWDVMERLLDACASPHDLGDLEARHDILGHVLRHAQTGLLKRLMDASWTMTDEPAQDSWLHRFVSEQGRQPKDPPGWLDTLDLILTVDHDAMNAGRRNYHGWTPLALAAASGHAPMIEALMQRGALPNQPVQQALWDDFKIPAEKIWSDDGITPLHLAASQNFVDACRALLHHGADPYQRAGTPWTYDEIRAMYYADQRPESSGAPGLTAVGTAQHNGAFAAAAVIEQALLTTDVPAPSASTDIPPRPRSRL